MQFIGVDPLTRKIQFQEDDESITEFNLEDLRDPANATYLAKYNEHRQSVDGSAPA